MSTVLTGAAADPTTSPTATCPADADTGNAASVNGAFQSILNFVAWVRTYLVPSTGGTFTGGVNGITPTAPANLTRKDYVDGAITGLAAAPTWTTITLNAGWAIQSSMTPGYWADPTGVLHLRGFLKRVAGGNATFAASGTIPSAYRASATRFFPVVLTDDTGNQSPRLVTLATDGSLGVHYDMTANLYLSLDGITVPKQ